MNEITFEAFPKIPRLNRTCVISEKLDGTNAQVIITNDGQIGAASRSRLITPDQDNYGFARWVEENKETLLELGPGRHFGEWWGSGIQRNYGVSEKKFALFNVDRWQSSRPACCDVVPVLYRGEFNSTIVSEVVKSLVENGSVAAPGFMKPEGVIVFLHSSRTMFKVTCENDEKPKGQVND